MEETTRASSLAAGLRHGHVAPHARACREWPEKLKPRGVAAGRSKAGTEGGEAAERERERDGGARGKDGTVASEADLGGVGMRGADRIGMIGRLMSGVGRVTGGSARSGRRTNEGVDDEQKKGVFLAVEIESRDRVRVRV